MAKSKSKDSLISGLWIIFFLVLLFVFIISAIVIPIRDAINNQNTVDIVTEKYCVEWERNIGRESLATLCYDFNNSQAVCNWGILEDGILTIVTADQRLNL